MKQPLPSQTPEGERPAPGIRCSLVIPAYNEETRILPLFDAIPSFDGELIVVCDGNDRTPDVVDSIAARRPDLTVRCLRFGRRLGKGGGVIAGLAAARAPFVGYFDADGSTGIGEMERLFGMLGDSDGVIGSRWMPGSTLRARQGLMRRLESRGFNILIRVLFGLRFSDTQCGAKVFRKEAVDRVLGSMRSHGFEFDVELLWRMKAGGFRITETPIEWQNRGDSRVRKLDMLRMFAGLIAIRLWPGPV
ncbi:MAG TPA: dolichyl-phosphate beta-glucosyltransferase [Methanoregula sp.]|nr:dolichyl-phosphate beta-glucosyltransferase [Methanoregula sp.]